MLGIKEQFWFLFDQSLPAEAKTFFILFRNELRFQFGAIAEIVSRLQEKVECSTTTSGANEKRSFCSAENRSQSRYQNADVIPT